MSSRKIISSTNDETSNWRGHGFSDSDRDRWRRNLVHDPIEAAQWNAAGMSPDEVEALKKRVSGATPEFAVPHLVFVRNLHDGRRELDVLATVDRMRSSLKPQRVQSWEAGVLDGACIGNLSGGLAIETWGDEACGIAVRDNRTLDRVWVRFESRKDANWERLVQAMRAGDVVEMRMEALLRRRGGLDKRGEVNVLVGRSTDGGVLLSFRPVAADAPNGGFAATVHRDDAHRFANAMEIADSQRRRDYVAKLESLRQQHDAEVAINNELSR